MKCKLSKFLYIIRFVCPIFVFIYFHPFFSMIINEGIIDGILDPHQPLFKNVTCKQYNRKGKYDIALDFWGFLNSLKPVINKNNNYYHIFDNYRIFLLTLYIWRQIGIILILKYKNLEHLKYFPNFYIGAYIAITGCSYFKIKNKKDINIIIILCMIISYMRELILIKKN